MTQNLQRLVFTDIASLVVAAYARAGYAWPELVDGFGGDGTGLPSISTFQELADDVVTSRLCGQPEADLKRIMRSTLYRRHYDVDRHFNFTEGDESIQRTDLIALAVWNYLYDRMESEYVEPENASDDDEDGPQQLVLSL